MSRQAARSVVETRRINGKVLQKHVASFGYAPLPLMVPDRIQFWTRMHERLGLHAGALETLVMTRRGGVMYGGRCGAILESHGVHPSVHPTG